MCVGFLREPASLCDIVAHIVPQICRLPTVRACVRTAVLGTQLKKTHSKLRASEIAAAAAAAATALCGGAIHQKDAQAKKNYEMAIIIVGTRSARTHTHTCTQRVPALCLARALSLSRRNN